MRVIDVSNAACLAFILTARDVVALAVQKIAEAYHQLGSVASVRG